MTRPSPLPRFAYRVTDAEELWGDMRTRAKTERAARRIVRADLVASEVEPNGSLLPRFKLTLFPRGS